MRGNVVAYDPGSHTGLISGHDGNRYQFARTEWKGAALPRAGQEVDFTQDGQMARGVFAVAGVRPRPTWPEFLFSFQGRISRSEYWLRFILPYFILILILTAVDFAVGTYDDEAQYGILSGLFTLAAIWPSLAVAVKRCHDRDRSGWFLLIALIPIIGTIWLIIELGFLRGTVGDNRFGPDPLAA